MTEKRVPAVSRRQVLAGTGVVAGAVALGATGCAETEQAVEQTWDLEADIVCVGSGAAGSTAAVVAADKGNQVILIEKAPTLGGTTNKSAGVVWVPNSAVLREQGIDDRRDDCLRYMVRYSYPQHYDPDSKTLGLEPQQFRMLEAFYDNGSATIDALEATGAVKFVEFSVGAGVGAPPDYADHLPENKVPRGRSLVPLGPDGTPIPGLIGDGVWLTQPLENWLVSQDIPVLTETAVTGLIESDGRVIGVEIESASGKQTVRARKGVIFGTGGYSHNMDLIGKHQTAVYGSCAVEQATGDFIGLAGAIGAQMGDLTTAWRSQVVFEETLESRLLPQCAFVLPADSMIVVNKHGKRVMNEKRNYNDRTEVHFEFDPVAIEYPNQLLFMLFDGRAVNAFGEQYPIPHQPSDDPFIVQGDTIEELETNLTARLNKLANRTGGFGLGDGFSSGVRSTIARYNAFAEAGEDLDFGRGSYGYDRAWQKFFSIMREDTTQPPNNYPNSAMYPVSSDGPYYVIILAAGALDTSGGPQINEKAQVLGADGNPIPGLYGAGNCIASPSREAYYGAGGTIGLAMSYGYIAAQNADMGTV